MEKFKWQTLSPSPIIGVDEVGRGCLAGPVYAAAVIINPKFEWQHYTDSKLLSASRRELLALEIQSNHQAALGFATAREIERYNILNASLLAMSRAVKALGAKTGHLLVDGKFKIPKLDEFSQTTLIKGDLRAEPVAAASIVAKVARDRILTELAEKYPDYGFSQHKGYATEKHQEAIRTHGPCPEHRRTFGGVREYLHLTTEG